MFNKYFETIMAILNARGTFDTDPDTVVNTVLYTLAGLVQADHATEATDVANVPTVADLELVLDRVELSTRLETRW
jgi:hypothetical protein